MNFFLKEAWREFRTGMGSGVVMLIYLVLVGYLLLVLCNADYLRDMGAVDVPRNAPALVYLMSSGMAFFLFFVWAWVFAQPVLRDRAVNLHEVVLAAPVSLRHLLAARFTGALGVAVVIGSSQVAGFFVSPVLEWMGAAPAGSFAPAPWLAFGWSMLVFILPLALGSGALYFMAALRSRGLGGPFAVAAALMAFWMVSMIILKDGHVDPFYFSLLDPSGYAETEHQVLDHWTPHEKSTALIALTPALIWNRVLWCGIPPLLLVLMILRARREWLVLEKTPRAGKEKGQGGARHLSGLTVPEPISGSPAWHLAVWRESLWQIRLVLHRPWMWATLGFLCLLAVAGAFVHGVQHAYGPMTPRPELVTPLLSTMFYLIIVFMLAGLVGLAARRDSQGGMDEMLDAAPAPGHVRLTGRILAMAALTVVFSLIPACGGMLTTLLVAPESLRPLLPLIHQVVVMAPGLLEIGAMTLLLHALILRPGPAYAASMMAAFIMIVNHEANLVTYPPFQIGLPVRIGFSGLTGLVPWAERLWVSDAFKLSVAALLLSFTAMFLRRGTDTGLAQRWRVFRRGLAGRPGVAACLACLSLFFLNTLMRDRYVTEGGYEARSAELAADAAWEARWLEEAGPFTLSGGHVVLEVYPEEKRMEGWWRLRGVRAEKGVLHAELPHGLRLTSTLVGGREVEAVLGEDHAALHLGDCGGEGCEVLMGWSLGVKGWDTERRPSWLMKDAFWLHAVDVLPRLGFDGDRVLRVPRERAAFGLQPDPRLPPYRAALASGAAAPWGAWTYEVRVRRGDQDIQTEKGALSGLLDFVYAWTPAVPETRLDGLRLVHDASRKSAAAAVAEDLAAMEACVARRLGAGPRVRTVAQWPRELGETRVSGDWLMLREDPHWDVAETGVGRALRRSAIAAALARRQIRDGADLREGEGGLWLQDGLSGAVGLLCAGEAGMETFSALLSHGADEVAKALAASDVPVTDLRSAPAAGWASDYAPLAALDWTARQSAESLGLLLARSRQEGPAGALMHCAGENMATAMLGPPAASDLRVAGKEGAPGVSGERWRWLAGGWETRGAAGGILRYALRDGRLVAEREGSRAPSGDGFFLDDWISYERAPADNLWRSGF